MKKKNRLILSVATLLLLTLLCLSACTSDSEVVWDETFIQELNPDAEIMKQLSSAVQDIDLTSTRDDVTVHIKQTLGDAKTMYIALDITYPDERDNNESGIESDGAVPPDELRPNICELITGTVQYADIQGKNPDLIKHLYLNKKAMYNGGGNFTTLKSTSQGNTISCLISLNSDNKSFPADRPITLMIGDFYTFNGDENITIYPEIHLISWTPTNEAPLIERTITTEDNQIIGGILLSPFSFAGHLSASDYETVEEFYQSIHFITPRGTEFKPAKGVGIGGSFSLPGGAASQSFLFKQPIDLNTIKEIEIGGYTVDVQAK